MYTCTVQVQLETSLKCIQYVRTLQYTFAEQLTRTFEVLVCIIFTNHHAMAMHGMGPNLQRNQRNLNETSYMRDMRDLFTSS